MENELKKLTSSMKQLKEMAKELETSGDLKPSLEVGPISFVQLLQATSVYPDKKEPVTWQYFQFWVNSLPKDSQERIIGAYIGEPIGACKIIGIFDLVMKEVEDPFKQ